MRKIENTKFIGLLFTLVMVAASTAPLLASASHDTDARATGNESLSVSINEEVYDRGTGIAVSVIASNLDSNTEYSLEWELCLVQYNQCNIYDQYAAEGGPPAAPSLSGCGGPDWACEETGTQRLPRRGARKEWIEKMK